MSTIITDGYRSDLVTVATSMTTIGTISEAWLTNGLSNSDVVHLDILMFAKAVDSGGVYSEFWGTQIDVQLNAGPGYTLGAQSINVLYSNSSAYLCLDSTSITTSNPIQVTHAGGVLSVKAKASATFGTVKAYFIVNIFRGY